ncbi:hypothetical protein U0C82_14680 [Fulvimarina sp. 2208YS6-2-32]|uniref:DUF333 domain-containing protein n=1 Tax=Fulvimarina uroteuthidis TaxID=3098149 RepID=A0ABU5I4R1_9HYPH|nr:hypothetical protein [Fulvimarina sp. 2208YS6-2-32]
MEHVAALMLLVGCSADVTSCREVPVPAPAYESIQDCRRDLGLQIKLADTRMPKLYGACEAVDEGALEQSASLEWSVTRDGKLDIDIVQDADQLVASR